MLFKLDKRLHKLGFYLGHIAGALKPRFWATRQWDNWQKTFQSLDESQKRQLMQRVNYYNKVETSYPMNSTDFLTASQFRLGDNNSSYFLDVATLLPYFPKNVKFAYQFGDVISIPSQPSWVKSRPIEGNNATSVLLKLDSVRHFYIPKDRHAYQDKIPKLVWRGAAHQPHRIAMLEKFAGHELLDIGCVAERSLGKPYHVGYLSIAEQQRYQFILSIEGNDVATNLKWIMASDSLCFMTRPKFETWFMEGSLRPDYHYVEVKDDYSDLLEKVDYYHRHPQAAQAIIQQANQYVAQFFDKKQERLLQLLVMQKYFSQQLE